MICYRDMTFCSSDCKNTSCSRNLTPDVTARARQWWGGDDTPIAVSDFSDDCEHYQPPRQKDENND